MDSRFPECKELNAAYQRCFSAQPFKWGTANGHEEDACEDVFEAFKECVENSLEKKKEAKAPSTQSARGEGR